LDLQRYQSEYGSIFSKKLEENMAPLVAAGLIVVNERRATLTKRGFLLSNEALVRLST
jgi:coproporphyrinogen III oxidase-like Fe-S oxidoreductase